MEWAYAWCLHNDNASKPSLPAIIWGREECRPSAIRPEFCFYFMVDWNLCSYATIQQGRPNTVQMTTTGKAYDLGTNKRTRFRFYVQCNKSTGAGYILMA